MPSKRKRKEMEFKLNSNDAFLKSFKAYIDAMCIDNRNRHNKATDYFLTHMIAYLNRITDEQVKKLLNNPDYLSWAMSKIMENREFISMIRYGLGWYNESYPEEMESLINNRMELLKVIRNNMEKSLYNMHLSATKRIARNTQVYFNGKETYYDYQYIVKNPFYEGDYEEEIVNLGWRDESYKKILVDGSYYDVFGIVKAFEESDEVRVGIAYKKENMENKIKEN
jgi:hypothetical protein